MQFINQTEAMINFYGNPDMESNVPTTPFMEDNIAYSSSSSPNRNSIKKTDSRRRQNLQLQLIQEVNT